MTHNPVPANPALGLRVSYEDMANPKRVGVITAVNTSRWGTDYTVTWDSAKVADPDANYVEVAPFETRVSFPGQHGWQVVSLPHPHLTTTSDKGYRKPVKKTPDPVKVLAAKLWREKHKDYKGKGADGVKRILFLNPATGATESWPVEEVARYELAKAASK